MTTPALPIPSAAPAAPAATVNAAEVPTHIAKDGPDYAPNRFRRVVLDRMADTPGFFRCWDVDARVFVTVAQGKLTPIA